ncbi:hypothetical protein C5167_030553 [Papaver somniferum]|uniref:major latex protein 146-like n=1 Tax=Papaver somniferum TaxID=3469 RepID=UPI000E70514F|nr:major latex protein 146-like [Papaver somniferum]RZC86477.1 hypothetical protein C5167_030553 [Papaver somniferum]
MTEIHQLHVEDELKNCSADQFYSFLKNDMTTLPQVCPHMFKSFEILAGDGKSAGTIWIVKFATGTSHEEMVKEKIVAMDDESRTISFSIIEGDLLRKFPKVDYTMTVTPIVTQEGREKSCLVKMCAKYEKQNEDTPPPHEYMEMTSFMNKAIASHLANKT